MAAERPHGARVRRLRGAHRGLSPRRPPRSRRATTTSRFWCPRPDCYLGGETPAVPTDGETGEIKLVVPKMGSPGFYKVIRN